jgi:hypothetical protein
MTCDAEKEQIASELRGSLLAFTKYFFKHVTNKEFIVSHPLGRESHHITICRALTKVKDLEVLREIINVQPGSGKSTLLSMFTAWCMAQYPDSNFLYISYSHELASKHTSFIKSIISSPMFRYLFEVEVSQDTRAKDSFKTTAGGGVRAFGSSGSVTGQDSGLPGLDRFSGCTILDDCHKPDEVFSDTMRQGVIDNYDQTIRQRVRGLNVPIVCIAQRLHEDDLPSWLMSGKDTDEWHTTILKSLDGAGNALYPEMMPASKLLVLKEKSPYVYSSQYQQEPIPSGGSLFKPDWFVKLQDEPEIITTFITCDTAETDKAYNDASVFSFWGIYEIKQFGKTTGELGLHWIDCLETRIEPKDLEHTFMDFYSSCCMHGKPPMIAAIEKKSTGVTLISVLSKVRCLQVREIERTRASGSKTQRFLEIQPYVASKRISFSEGARHFDMCVNHMVKITANNTHRHDDIADTLADGIRIALIEKTLYNVNVSNKAEFRKSLSSGLNENINKKLRLGNERYERSF